MRHATIRWMIFLSAMLAVGPAASWLLRPVTAVDGSHAATPLASADPAGGLVRALLASLIALGMGLLACRIAGFRSAMSAVGLVLAWVAWRTADADQLVRAAGSGAPLGTLAVEGAVLGVVALAIVALLALIGRRVEPGEEGDIGEGTPLRRLIGGARAPVVVAAGLVGAAAGAWLVAATPMKGQALAGAVAGGIAAAAAGRLAEPRAPLPLLVVPIGLLAVLGPLSGLLLAGRGGVVGDAYRVALAPLANVTPLDWLAGAFLGIPLGAAWVTSVADKHAPQPARS